MIITSLEWISRTKVKVYLNDEYAFTMTPSEVHEVGLEMGLEMTDELMTDCMSLMLHRAKLKAMTLLQSKDYTEYEMNQKLKKDGFPTALINSAVDYVKSFHYIDDERYVQNYVQYHSSGLSKQMIRQKLLQKGISSELITDMIDDIELDETDTIRHILITKYDHRIFDDESKKQKAIGYLLRKGYKYSDISSVIKQLSTND